MTPEQQVAVWFLATLLPFCVNGFFGQRPDAVGASAMMIIGWGFQRVCWAIWSPPEALQLYPLIDLAFGMTMLGAWGSEKRAWKLILGVLFLVQCALHASFWFHPVAGSLLRYLGLNNMLYALELCVAASPGVGSALAVLLGDWGGHHPHARPHPGP